MSTVQLSLDGHAAREHATRQAPALPLRPYQAEAIDAVVEAESRGINRPAVVLPCGTGKTVTFAHLIARRPGRALVIAHRDELLEQAKNKLHQVAPALELGTVKAERDEVAADVVMASIQTIARPSRLARLGRDFTTVIVDECFPAGTLVGDTPIEQVKVGDLVPSYDETTGQLEHRRVTHTWRRAAAALVRVTFAGAPPLVCTPNHPVLTPGGWMAAGDLMPGQEVARALNSADRRLHVVRQPDLLQARRGRPDPQGGRRGRWAFARSAHAQGAGRQEGPVLGWARVDRVALLEPRRDGTFGGVCPDGQVYNLEVDGTHTYLANGVVAHNCHHSAAATYVAALQHLGAFTDDGPLVVGFTATLERADNAPLGAVWQTVAYERGILWMIANGYLCDLRAIQVGTDADLAKLKVRHGDLQDAEIGAELLRSGAIGQVAGAYVNYAHDRRGLAFTPTVQTAHVLAGALRERGISAEALDGTTHPEVRRAIVARLQTGETQVGVNCGIFTEGTDLPATAAVLIARPTRSRVLLTQQVGRGTRLHPGKDDCVVLDLAGVTQRHDLATVAELAGLDPADLEGRTVTEALAARQARDEQARAAGSGGGEETLRLPGITVQVPMFRSKMRWLTVAGTYVLPCDDGAAVHLVAAGDASGDAWRVEGRRRGREPKVLASNLSLEYAQGFGEDIARRFRGGALASADASWRARPPSQRQLAALAKWRIKVPKAKLAGLTAGDVSDLINTAAAKAAAGKTAR